MSNHKPTGIQIPQCTCRAQNCHELTVAQRIDFYSGAYEMCKLLLTSPRMKKAQVEIIEEQAEDVRVQLEALGVKFTERGDQT